MDLQRHEQSEEPCKKTDPCNSPGGLHTQQLKPEGGYRQLWQEVQKLDSIFAVWYSARGLPSGSVSTSYVTPPMCHCYAKDSHANEQG